MHSPLPVALTDRDHLPVKPFALVVIRSMHRDWKRNPRFFLLRSDPETVVQYFLDRRDVIGEKRQSSEELSERLWILLFPVNLQHDQVPFSNDE